MKVYSTTKTGSDGLQYNLRMLLDLCELQGLQSAGIVGQALEVVGMQDVADSLVAGFEKQAFTACGGVVQ